MSDIGKSAISEIGVDTPIGPLTLRERDGTLIAVSWGKPAAEQEA